MIQDHDGMVEACCTVTIERSCVDAGRSEHVSSHDDFRQGFPMRLGSFHDAQPQQFLSILAEYEATA